MGLVKAGSHLLILSEMCKYFAQNALVFSQASTSL